MPADYLPVPHLEQTTDGGCLPACVAMILAHLKEPVDQGRLARLFDTQEFGTVAPRIHKLTDWGYATTYQSGSLATLQNLLASGVPPIVFVWTGGLPHWSVNTPHAVVVIGMDEERVLVNDPALGEAPQSIPLDAFLLAWAEFDNRYATITRR